MNQQQQDQWASELLTKTLDLAWYDSEPQARYVADAAARYVAEMTRDYNALLGLIADIRAAAGDSQGKLMQPELVAHIRALQGGRRTPPDGMAWCPGRSQRRAATRAQ
jgi:hypothetical protein